jgi:hypothetical protein
MTYDVTKSYVMFERGEDVIPGGLAAAPNEIETRELE